MERLNIQRTMYRAKDKTKCTFERLGEMFGYDKGASQRVFRMFSRPDALKACNMVELLDAMGYEVIIRNRLNPKEQWSVKPGKDNT